MPDVLKLLRLMELAQVQQPFLILIAKNTVRLHEEADDDHAGGEDGLVVAEEVVLCI